MKLIKAHAFGNDFLMVASADMPPLADEASLARHVCDRRRGIGADGLMIFDEITGGAAMRLRNADGSHSEISGNGVRCLAAWIASRRGGLVGQVVEIDTEAGVKPLTLLERRGARYTFRAAMGHPSDIGRVALDVLGQQVEVVTMRVGNPQAVVLGPVTQERLHTLAAALAVHPHFPRGTNVELARAESPDTVRILIWERGVGPTEASGTGACAAAVAAHRYGGSSHDVQVISPGGSQRVEWLLDGLHLTGWAELAAAAEWIGAGVAGDHE